MIARPIAPAAIAVAVSFAGCCGIARADGGRLRISEQTGPWQVSVFTSPTPLWAGAVDVSVFVQRADSGEAAQDVAVTVDACHASTGDVVSRSATTAAATNKLFRSALLDLGTPGRWRVSVTVAAPPAAPQAVGFDIEVGAIAPRWPDTRYWIGWPLLPIALFAVHQFLVRRKDIRYLHGAADRHTFVGLGPILTREDGDSDATSNIG
jgi:hypothetical protein